MTSEWQCADDGKKNNGCEKKPPLVSSWTAARRGAPRHARAGGADPGKRSMLQRYGWYIGATLFYLVYKRARGGGGGKPKTA